MIAYDRFMFDMSANYLVLRFFLGDLQVFNVPMQHVKPFELLFHTLTLKAGGTYLQVTRTHAQGYHFAGVTGKIQPLDDERIMLHMPGGIT